MKTPLKATGETVEMLSTRLRLTNTDQTASIDEGSTIRWSIFAELRRWKWKHAEAMHSSRLIYHIGTVLLRRERSPASRPMTAVTHFSSVSFFINFCLFFFSNNYPKCIRMSASNAVAVNHYVGRIRRFPRFSPLSRPVLFGYIKSICARGFIEMWTGRNRRVASRVAGTIAQAGPVVNRSALGFIS